MDAQAVAEAVDEVGRVLRADGADLLLVDADPRTLRIRLSLRLDDVSCADCVLPPDQLAETVALAIRRRVPGEFELLLDDPADLTVAASADPTAPSDAGDAVHLWTALVDVYQPVLRDVVTALERDAGIDSGTYSALAYLDRASGALRIGELHTLMRVRYSQPGLSRLVQRMEADGLVARAVDPADRRATVVSWTPQGRARYRAARAVYDAALAEHLGTFVDAREVATLTASLRRIAAARPG